MSRKELEKAYKNCLNLRYRKRLSIPYKDLDLCLHVVELYLEFTKGVTNE